MDHLVRHIESLIFVAEVPLSVRDIKSCLTEAHGSPVSRETVEEAIAFLQEQYTDGDYAMEVVKISGGYQFMTKPIYHHTVGTYLKQLSKKKLSKAALETLSIIAYRQPVIKSEVESIRGVSCDYSIQKLLDKELVEITGRSEGPGRPLLYGTSPKFMDYFGLRDLSDLPKLKDIAPVEDDVIIPQQPITEEE